MKTVLVSLVGDQTVPNVFLILDEAFRGVEEYLFITTPLMEQRKRLAHILQATGLPPERCRVLQVAADELSDIFAKLEGLQLPGRGVHYYVNLTSGTKLMSIGLYDYFSRGRYADCSSIFYIPIGRNAYVQVEREGPPQISPLSYRIGVAQYLASYGLSLSGQGECLHSPVFNRTFASRMISMRQSAALARAMHGLRQAYNRNRGKGAGMALPVDEALGEVLEGLGYPCDPAQGLSAGDARYLTGGWLEEWAALQVSEILGLPAAGIALQARVARQGRQVENECDLLFTYHNTLYVLECKAGLGKRGGKIFEEAIYKLSTLRTEFGQRVPAVFLTPEPLRPSYERRAALHQVHLFSGEGWAAQFRSFLEGLRQAATAG